MIQSKKAVLIVLFFGFVISTLFTINNLNKYDVNLVNDSGDSYHQMIKGDSYRYLSHGNKIKDQLQNGINFFETGRSHFTKYLPPRIAAAYYYFFNLNLFDETGEKKINLGIHTPYLVLQSIFYFFSVSMLYLSVSKVFNRRISFYIILFLSLEPTINQYHSSFWSESFLFSFTIILIALIIKPNPNVRHFFLVGFFLAVLSLQKEYMIFYIIPVIIYYLFTLKDQRLKNITVLLLGFIIIQSILGFNNLKRSGEFYILSSTTKITLHTHLAKQVISEVQNLDNNEFFDNEGKIVLEWITKNSIPYNQNSKGLKVRKSLGEYRSSITKEKDLVRLDNYITSRTFNYMLQYPFDFTKHILKKSIHITLLNPLHIYSDNKYASGEFYYNSPEHDKIVNYRIFYTLAVYLVCLFGLISMFKKKNYKILSFLTISILCFYLPVSWIGNTRNYVPCLLFISFFFAFGVDRIHVFTEEIKKNKIL